MDEYKIDEALKAYERIEKGIVELAEHVPLVPNNETMKLPALIPFIIDACGLLDSILRDKTPNSVTIAGKIKSRKDCDIRDFADLHADALDLPNTRSVLLVSPPRYWVPFEPWKNLLKGGPYSPLLWWQDYNALKHDRLLNIEKATLRIALDATCGLQQVIARRIDLVPLLLRRGWFSTGRYVVDGVLEEAKRGMLSETFVVQTRLFATPIGKEQFPVDLEELRPGLFECKREFIEFLGRLY